MGRIAGIAFILIICNFNTITGQMSRPHPPKPQPCGYAMTPEAFNRLIILVDRQTFNDDKMLVIEAASLGGYFTCSQAAAMMSHFQWSDKKLAVLEYMAPHITDIRHAGIILDQFTFDSEKKKAWNIISGYPENKR